MQALDAQLDILRNKLEGKIVSSPLLFLPLFETPLMMKRLSNRILRDKN